MSDTIIRVENLGKKYIISHQQEGRSNYTALRDVIANGAKSLIKRFTQPPPEKLDKEEFWALKDVSFEIKQGDVVGIIGRNGAGKSTLLKILSRITEPTTGRISIKGRVASLLEVGTGFHPELTGRENIYLNGAILGMSRVEIKKKFDEIVAFAEVEKFLDTPVKRYSSGMYVRLAFAVAAHLEPEILVVDEVLAVGDAAFQKKCLGKMGDVATKEGRTVLFVSHNMGTIKSLCNSGVLLNKGNLVKHGITSEIVDSYLLSDMGKNREQGEIYWLDSKTAPGGKEMRLISIRLLNHRYEVQYNFDSEQLIHIEISYKLFEVVRGMRMILQVINSEGVLAFASTDHAFREEESKPGEYHTICTIPPYLLNSGLYFIKIHSGCPGVKVLIQGQEFLNFFIEKSIHHGSLFSEKWPGVVAPKLNWNTKLITKI
ncbi:MAG: ABC transporter ATP-binding protein [Xenococcaceae cyanobacterium MO_167.B27]|nr:ABC transporter ATP-binding protein [Xenococcaceae cyanobacterium MO_167.B27]